MIVATSVVIVVGIVVAWLSASERDVLRAIRRQTVRRINAVLPQTQCRQCGYDGCAPYAEAIVYQNESIFLCPPGGAATQHALARMLGCDSGAVLRSNADVAKRVAVIVEANCIGCTKCIQVCPVDAIIGANGMMHTVVSSACTGCDLCAPVCPTDCIEMHEPRVQTRQSRQSEPLRA